MDKRTDNLSNRNRYFVRGAFHRFFIPAVMSSFWMAVAAVVDSIFVGNRFGAAGLAAISFGQPIYLFYNILSYGFSIGGSIYYAGLLAEGKAEEGNRIFLTIVRLLLGIYLITGSLGLIFLPRLMVLLGTNISDSITRTYVQTQLIFVPIMFLQGPFYYFVNADNGPKTAAFAMSVSGITDTVFSYIFIIRMRLGVAGSVYSTVVGALLMLLITGRHIVKKKGELRFCFAKMDWHAVPLAAKTGFATSLQYLYQFVTMIAVNHLLMRLGGEAAVAAFDVVYNISLLSNSFSEAAVVASEPMLSSYRSERNLGNIRITLHLTLFWAEFHSALFSVILILFSRWFSILFGMSTGIELQFTSMGVRIFALSILPAAANYIFSGYYQTIFQEWLAYLITFLRSFVLYLVALFLCSLKGMDTFWYVFLLAEVLTLMIWIPVSLLRGGLYQLSRIHAEKASTAMITGSDQDINRVVQQMQDFCEVHGAEEKQTMYIGLTIEEICCAIVERFRDSMGEIYIQATVVVEEDGATLYLRDNAFAYDPLSENTEGIDLEEGRQLELVGLRIVQKKAKEFYYRRYSGFNTLVIQL